MAKSHFLFAAVVAGLAPVAAAAPAGAPTIVYETAPGPFCGPCNSIKLTVGPTGRVKVEQGHWAGFYADWRVERRQVWVSEERLAAFRLSLATVRPVEPLQVIDDRNCIPFVNDSPSITVRWRENSAEARLIYDLGCTDPKRAAMREALTNAPAILGIRVP